MGYDSLESSLGVFGSIMAGLGVKLADDSPIKRDFDTTTEFLNDKRTMAENAWLEKWSRRVKEFYDAQIVVKRLVDAVVALRGQARLKGRLKKVLGGPLTQDFVPDAAKDHFYELEMAALWAGCGFAVELAEPDVVISGNGLSAPLGVACKYPSGLASLHEHISKGYRQIAKQGYDGLVVIGLDQLACKGMSNFMDFRQGSRHPLEVMESLTADAMTRLVALRAQDYPSERPIDGAMLTMSAVGIYGQPAQLTSVRHVTVQCDGASPGRADLGVLYRGMQAGGAS